MEFPRHEYWSCHSLLQGLFLTQGSNLVSCTAGRFFHLSHHCLHNKCLLSRGRDFASLSWGRMFLPLLNPLPFLYHLKVVNTDSMYVSLSELWEMVMDREAWRAAIHGVTKGRAWLSDWTELNWTECHLAMSHGQIISWAFLSSAQWVALRMAWDHTGCCSFLLLLYQITTNVGA